MALEPAGHRVGVSGQMSGYVSGRVGWSTGCVHGWVRPVGEGNGEWVVWKRLGEQVDSEKAACRRVSQWEGTRGEVGCIHWLAEQGELGDGKRVGGQESRAEQERRRGRGRRPTIIPILASSSC